MITMNKAVSRTIRVTLADGNEYKMSTIRMTHWCEFCDWINTQNDRSLGVPVSMEEMIEHASTVKGMMWLLWRSLYAHSPEMDYDAAALLMGSLDDIGTIFESVSDLDADGADEGSDPPGP